jgi:ectoine hydroxylase-related dioxygenase (phytanoyl-CoA dioxygenase family)
MASSTIAGALDDLLGVDWGRPARWGVPLVTFPDRTLQWDVPHQFWHLDTPAMPESPAVARVFVILEPLAARGGGTLVVTGSHRVFQSLAARVGRPLRSSEANRRLRAEQPWFAALSSNADNVDRIRRYMSEGAQVDGVLVRVVEMTGQAGDAFLMHPSLLHTPSPNVGAQPRLMLTQWIDGHACRQANE